jgi:DNA ligase (NAD+)
LNENCPAVITGRIDRYLTSLDILGIGENLIQSIVAKMGIEDPSDLYLLRWRKTELANLVLSGGVKLGEKRAERLIEEIEKKKELTISEFLGSLNIFGLGKRRVALIQEKLPGELDTLEDWFTDKLIKNADQCGVKNMAQGIYDELLKKRDYIQRFIDNGVVITKPKPKQQLKAGASIFCITGALTYPKSYYQNLIENAGHGYSDSLSKIVTHLVAADPNSGSNKLEKAKKAGTNVISEAELLAMIS